MTISIKDPLAVVRRAWDAFERRDTAEAIALSQEALRADPAQIDALGALGFFLHSRSSPKCSPRSPPIG
jgi:hypothetical protein